MRQLQLTAPALLPAHLHRPRVRLSRSHHTPAPSSVLAAQKLGTLSPQPSHFFLPTSIVPPPAHSQSTTATFPRSPADRSQAPHPAPDLSDSFATTCRRAVSASSPVSLATGYCARNLRRPQKSRGVNPHPKPCDLCPSRFPSRRPPPQFADRAVPELRPSSSAVPRASSRRAATPPLSALASCAGASPLAARSAACFAALPHRCPPRSCCHHR
jgi:hypothetical protein